MKEKIKEHNPNWPQILNHPYRILIAGSSGSGKTKYKFLINKPILKLHGWWYL